MQQDLHFAFRAFVQDHPGFDSPDYRTSRPISYVGALAPIRGLEVGVRARVYLTVFIHPAFPDSAPKQSGVVHADGIVPRELASRSSITGLHSMATTVLSAEQLLGQREVVQLALYG